MTGQRSDFIDYLRRLGYAPAALTLLDVIQPIAPALAQGLYVAQPLARLWDGADALGDLAEALEEPEGLAQLRSRLRHDLEE